MPSNYDDYSPLEIPEVVRHDGIVRYFADGDTDLNGRRRHSMHMPFWASRINVKVLKVGAERLQDVSEEDAWAEGCKRGLPTDNGGFFPAEEPHPKGGFVGWDCALDWYLDLWDSLHGEGASEKNPWLWPLHFRLT